MIRRGRLLQLIATCVLLFVLSIGNLTVLFEDTAFAQTDEGVEQHSQVAGQGTALSPVQVQGVTQATPPEPTPEQLAASEAAVAKKARLKIPDLKVDPNAPVRDGVPITPASSADSANQPKVPGTFTLFKNTSLSSVGGNKSTVNEPSTADGGTNVFYTGNWFAAVSTNRGTSFSYINPYTFFSPPPGINIFCCDQDVVYDRSRGIFLWYLQYNNNANGNIGRLAVATTSSIATNTWWYYDIRANQVGSSVVSDWLDYPHLSLSSNYVYLASNIFDNVGSGNWRGTTLLRLPLSALATASGFNYDYFFSNSNFTFLPVQGSTTTLYFGSHNNNTSFRVFRWAESSTTIFWDDVAHASFAVSGYSCVGPTAVNECSRADSRVVAGWVGKGRIGFMWTAAQGNQGLGNFVYPYVFVLIVNESNRTILSQAPIWNGAFAWHTPSASVNARGDVGGTILWGAGSTTTVSAAAYLWDDFTPGNTLTPLENYTIATSNTASAEWGDYLRSRASANNGNVWVATVYSRQNNLTEPRFLCFGRERDLGCGAALYYYPLARPIRLIDTRAGATALYNGSNGYPRINANTTRAFTLANVSYAGLTIPNQAQVLAGNTTVVVPSGGGYLTSYPGPTDPTGNNRPLAASMVYGNGAVLSNATTLTLGPGGTLNVYSLAATDIVVDIAGYYAPPGTIDPNGFSSGLLYYPLTRPTRLIDTRAGATALYNGSNGYPRINAGTAQAFTLSNVSFAGLAVPSAARVLDGNTTVVVPSGGGYLTSYSGPADPTGNNRPLAASMVYGSGDVLSNATTLTLNGAGVLNVYSLAATDIVVDIAGFFAS